MAISGAAMLLASAVRGGQGAVAQAAMIRSLLTLTQAVYAASVAAAQERQARLLAEDTRARLSRVRAALPAPMMSTDAAARQQAATATIERAPLDAEAQAVLERVRASQARPATEIGSPVPNRVQPAERPKTPQPRLPGRDGIER